MCIIQAALFQKNGSVSFDRKAIITDKINVDTIVTFDVSENGIPVWLRVAIQTPDGGVRDFNTPTFNMGNGTQDIIVNIPISIYGTGIYKIIAVSIVDDYSGAYRCSAYSTSASYQSITVSGITPPPFTTIVVSPATVSIEIGKTQQLTATCKDSTGKVISCPTLLWISSKYGSVASVSQTGLVTGVAGGTAFITANYNQITSNFSDITVTPSVNLILKSNETSVTSGKSVIFYGTYKPNSDINIFIEGTIRTHIASVKTNSVGNFEKGVVLTSDFITKLKIGACNVGGLGLECNLLTPDKSNYVYIDIYPQTTTPPKATHKFVISLSPLPWANYTGLQNYLPSITNIFANLVTGYGIFSWNILETKLEGNDLIIYIQDIDVSTASVKSLPGPAAPVVAGISLTAIITATLIFGFLVIAWRFENILEAKVEVQKEITEIGKDNSDLLTEKYIKGEITYQQYIDGLALINELIKEGKKAGSVGICQDLLGLSDQNCEYIKYGALALGGLIILKIVSDLILKSK
jgi:uncharacterized membrane protein